MSAFQHPDADPVIPAKERKQKKKRQKQGVKGSINLGKDMENSREKGETAKTQQRSKSSTGQKRKTQ